MPFLAEFLTLSCLLYLYSHQQQQRIVHLLFTFLSNKYYIYNNTKALRRKEMYWQYKFNTFKPNGLNERDVTLDYG